MKGLPSSEAAPRISQSPGCCTLRLRKYNNLPPATRNPGIAVNSATDIRTLLWAVRLRIVKA
jgi:hypothetical protein